MDPITIFLTVTSVGLTAWNYYDKFRTLFQNSDRSDILDAIEQVNDNLIIVRDQIIDQINEAILFDTITDLIGDHKGLKNRYAIYPVTGSTMNPSDELSGIINDAVMLEGHITTEIDRCLTTNVPFKYACCLFNLYSSTMCFIYTAMDDHSHTYQSNYKDKKDLAELQVYSQQFYTLGSYSIGQAKGSIFGPIVEKTIVGNPLGDEYRVKIKTSYNIGQLDENYSIVSRTPYNKMKDLGVNPLISTINSEKEKLYDKTYKEREGKINALLAQDPLITLAKRNGEVIKALKPTGITLAQPLKLLKATRNEIYGRRPF